jgi:hypothetical protein
MAQTFYYSIDGQVTSIEADSWRQETSAGGLGECPVLYDWSLNCTAIIYRRGGLPPITYESSQYVRIAGPLSQYELPLPGALRGGMASWLAPSLEIKLNGVGVNSFSGSDPANNTKNRADNQLIGGISNQVITRVDGLPDNCGSLSCQTIFTIDGVDYFTLGECPVVTDTPPNECAECCAQLLPEFSSLIIL